MHVQCMRVRRTHATHEMAILPASCLLRATCGRARKQWCACPSTSQMLTRKCLRVQKSGVLHYGPAKTRGRSVTGFQLQLRHDGWIHRGAIGYSKVFQLPAYQEGGGSSCERPQLQGSDAAV